MPIYNAFRRLTLRPVFILTLAMVLLAAALSARTADFALVSLRFSAEHPVPHFRLEGKIEPKDAERIEVLFERHTRCAGPSCNTFGMGPHAVVSLATSN